MNVVDLESYAQNRILGALPQSELQRVKPDLHRHSFLKGKVLFEPDSVLTDVYFPVGAALSMLKIMMDGNAVEVGTVGIEGMGGVHAILGGDLVTERCIVQVPGIVYSMPVERLHHHYRELPRFRRVLQLYAQMVLASLSQSVACNRLHHINERCARWLLITQDRVGRKQFELTHEFLAVMLGANRPSVSVAAATLQQAGFISYTRGIMTIVDRDGLESVSCECYRVNADQEARILPTVPHEAGGSH